MDISRVRNCMHGCFVYSFYYSIGSAWAEYNKPETLHHVHGMKLPAGLKESEKLPDSHFPLFTPSTKAEQGAHDENISPDTGQLAPHSDPCRLLIVRCHLQPKNE